MVPASRGGAAFFRSGSRLKLASSGFIPGNQAIEIVAVRSVGAEGILIKETLDAAIEANLVGMVLSPDGPTHFAVPATAENDHPSTGQSSRQQAPRPEPPLPLLFFAHRAYN